MGSLFGVALPTTFFMSYSLIDPPLKNIIYLLL